MSARTVGGRGEGWSTKCGQAWAGAGGPKNSQICANILYGWPHILPTNLADILEHKNGGETVNAELDLNDDTGWDSNNYDEEIDCDVGSADEFDDWTHYWFKIVANAFQENTNFVYDFVLYFFFTWKLFCNLEFFSYCFGM